MTNPVVQVEFVLKLDDRHGVRAALTLPAAPAPLRRMLPVFRGLAHQVVDAGVARAQARGESVSCKAGCGACCRQLVGISRTEARALLALVEAMPEERRALVQRRFASALEAVERAGLLERVRAFASRPREERGALSAEYQALGVPCPFLEEESCSIYEQRPIICREYLVSSPPERCAQPSLEGVRNIRLRGGAFISDAVSSLEGEQVALVLALEWGEAHRSDEPAVPPAEALQRVLESFNGGPTAPETA